MFQSEALWVMINNTEGGNNNGRIVSQRFCDKSPVCDIWHLCFNVKLPEASCSDMLLQLFNDNGFQVIKIQVKCGSQSFGLFFSPQALLQPTTQWVLVETDFDDYSSARIWIDVLWEPAQSNILKGYMLCFKCQVLIEGQPVGFQNIKTGSLQCRKT